MAKLLDSRRNIVSYSRQLLFSLTFFWLVVPVAQAQFDYSPGFDAGAPEEMKKLAFLSGEWDIKLLYTPTRNAPVPEQWLPWRNSATESVFTPLFGGAFIRENCVGFPVNPPHEGFERWTYFATFSYDRFQKQYRCSIIDNMLGLQDIYEGNFKDGKLVLSNFNTGTYNNHGTNGGRQVNRIILSDMGTDRFVLTWQTADKPENEQADPDKVTWLWSVRMEYTKRKKEG